MLDTKSILSSKSVWGGIIAVVGAALGFFGFSLSPDDTTSILAHFDSIIVAAGALFAIYGRIVATKQIG